MSLEAYIWAANLPLSRCSGTPHRVLLQLADRADPLGYGAFPSAETIAETLECSTRTVRRALRDLVDAGLIRKGDQRFVEHFRADRRPVVYDVLTAALVYREGRDDPVTLPSPRGDNPVTPSHSRGDRYGPHGVTTGVLQTVLNPTYQDSRKHLTLVTAREIEERRSA